MISFGWVRCRSCVGSTKNGTCIWFASYELISSVFVSDASGICVHKHCAVAADWVKTTPTDVRNQMTVKVYGFAILSKWQSTQVKYVKYVVHCLFILATQSRHTQRLLANISKYVCVCVSIDHRRTIWNTWKYWTFSQYSKQATIFTATPLHLVTTRFALNPLSKNTSADK